MTEVEWLACGEPGPMCGHLGPNKGQLGRKLRLVACACARLVWKRLVGVDRVGVETSELFADGLATAGELEEAHNQARFAMPAKGPWAHSADIARWTADAAIKLVKPPLRPGLKKAIVALIRDGVGNPFRPAILAPAQRTPTVVSLARAAYDERQLPGGELEPHRLAVLADALEEDGAVGDVLEHLRSPGPHVRGCWAVDLCLGLG